MSWLDFAKDVAVTWSRPRVGGFLPSKSLHDIADDAFWQAANIYAYPEDAAAWRREVLSHVPATCPYDVGFPPSASVPPRAPAEVPPVAPPALIPLPAPAAPPSPTPAPDPPKPAPKAKAKAAPKPPAPPEPAPAPKPAANPYSDDL